MLYAPKLTHVGLPDAGATRRNRPNLQPGDLVYCRVLTASRDLEPTLSCVDATGKVWRASLAVGAAPLAQIIVRTAPAVSSCGVQSEGLQKTLLPHLSGI